MKHLTFATLILLTAGSLSQAQSARTTLVRPERPPAISLPSSVETPPTDCPPPFVLRPGQGSNRRTIHYAPTASLVVTPYGYFPIAPSIVLLGPGFGYPPPFSPMPMPMPPVPVFGMEAPGLMLTPPNAQGTQQARPIVIVADQNQQQARGEAARPTVRGNADRASELVTIGDRLFRADNLTRASSRYQQALQADPFGAAPRVRLSQVALRRGDYREAAHMIREAITAEPEWLINAPDIQSIYAEPADFHAEIARMESHLQAHPNDRDAWLVLGTQFYLSHRAARASDIFLRLTDRPPDRTLTAFLEATRTRQ